MKTPRFTVLIRKPDGILYCVHTLRPSPADAALAATIHTHAEPEQVVAVLDGWADARCGSEWNCPHVKTLTTPNP